MRIDVSVPVRWPSQDRLDKAWRHEVHQLLVDLPPLEHGYLRPGEDSSDWSLVAGEHLAPGARYQIDDPALSAGTVELTLTGTSDDRTVTLTYQDKVGYGERSLRLDLDGLEECRTLHSEADLREVRWTIDLDVAARRLAVDVELDWARCEVRLEAGRELRLVLELEGTGMWRPTVAPLLAATKSRFEEGAVELLTGIAESLDFVEAHGRWALGPEQQLPACEAAWADVRRGLLAAEDATAAAGWGRRTGKRWRAAYDALPPPDHPPGEFTFNGPVARREARIADEVAAKRFGRRRLINQLVDFDEARDLDFLRLVVKDSQEPGPSYTGAGLRLTDRHLAGLRELASPWAWIQSSATGPDPARQPGPTDTT